MRAITVVGFFFFAMCAAPLVPAALARQARQAALPIDDRWRLRSSVELESADGAQLSKPGISVDQWYPVSVPSTVLAALVDNGVYPDPYYGEKVW